jgi:hypothetical protein
VKLKDSQLEIMEGGEKNSNSGKEMGMGARVTVYGCNRTVTV